MQIGRDSSRLGILTCCRLCNEVGASNEEEPVNRGYPVRSRRQRRGNNRELHWGENVSNISKAFQKVKQQNSAALIAYITAGDPTPEMTPKIADALVKGGVDILELGLPFSDPIADGPTIQAASLRALNAGTTPMRVLEVAKLIKNQHDVPLVVMTYYNPVFKLGLDNFLVAAKQHGVDGFIVPDLPVEESADYRKAAKAHDLDTIFLAAPSTSKERLTKIVDASSGFLYLVSRYGVTGAQTTVEDATVQLIKRIRPFTAEKVPLAVGFGISKPEHVKRIIAAGADAAIVGSAFINIIQNNAQNQKTMLKELQATATSLKSATKD
jgi:tryptophan synthase alpha chain